MTAILCERCPTLPPGPIEPPPLPGRCVVCDDPLPATREEQIAALRIQLAEAERVVLLRVDQWETDRGSDGVSGSLFAVTCQRLADAQRDRREIKEQLEALLAGGAS